MIPRIALIHAVRVAIPPIEEAFARLWPEAERMNVLDDALARDLSRDGTLTPAMYRRFAALTDYAVAAGAHGILFSCSAFGPAIEAARVGKPLPIFKPNEAMFREALQRGQHIGLLATFQPSIAAMTEEFHAMARAVGRRVELHAAYVPHAMAALDAGDTAQHDALVARAAAHLAPCDVVMLAQFSTARARAAVAGSIDLPVLSSPDSAVVSLRDALRNSA
jgi:Asp/Glu/hydantoin racemase